MGMLKNLVVQVEDLWEEGYSLFEIAEILNVEPELVEDALDYMDEARVE